MLNEAVMSKAPDNKPHRIIEENIVKYAVDANLFQIGSTNPKKNPARFFFSLLYWGLIVGGAFDLEQAK